MIKPLLCTLSLAVFATGCSATRVSVPRMAPAEIDVGGYKRLAIGGVGGRGGEHVSAELTRALFATQRFEVLDRQNLAQLTKEQDFQISGRVSDDSAVSIGQMIGAAALVVGDIMNYSYDENVSQQSIDCTEKAEKGKRPPKKKTCTDYQRTAKAQVTVSLKVLDTESGKVLAAKTLDAGDNRETKARDAMPADINAGDQMLAGCVKTIADTFARVIAPHTVQVAVELADDGDLPELERGNNYAKIGNWRQALGEYNAAVARLPGDFSNGDQAKAYYNLGVAYGYSGDLDRGIAELERSYALEPEDRTAAEIAKLKQFKIDDAELAKQQASAENAH
ncbi:MAG: CsgG/HfaB family protein [Myxococcota bacterium]